MSASRRTVLPVGGGRGRTVRSAATILSLIALAAVEAILLHQVFTAANPSANDFFPRWVGARALFFEGLNPYAAEVTTRIQIGMFGRLVGPSQDQVAFAYPLFAVFFVGPLAWLPYAWAQAVWQAILIHLLGLAVWIGLRLDCATPRRWLFPALLIGTIFFYPAARALILGQFAVIAVASLTIALWAQRTGKDRLAGVALALATVKPQLVFLIVPCWIGWAVLTRRWGTVGSFVATAGLLSVASALLLPGWPADFLRGLAAYQDYTRAEYGTRPVLRIALDWLPPGPADAAFWAIGLAATATAVWLWWRSGGPLRAPRNSTRSGAPVCDRPAPGIIPAYAATAIITLCFPFDQPTTNQLLLLPPIVAAINRAPGRWLAFALPIALIVPWAVFLLTQQNRVESPAQYFIVLVPAAVVATKAVGNRQ